MFSLWFVGSFETTLLPLTVVIVLFQVKMFLCFKSGGKNHCYFYPKTLSDRTADVKAKRKISELVIQEKKCNSRPQLDQKSFRNRGPKKLRQTNWVIEKWKQIDKLGREKEEKKVETKKILQAWTKELNRTKRDKDNAIERKREKMST